MKRLLIVAMCLVPSLMDGAHAQDKTYRIGVLVWRDTKDHEDGLAGFVSAMDATGLRYELSVGKAHENETAIAEYLRGWNDSKVDLILTFGTKGATWAMAQTKGIPIVAIGCVADPVQYGIAESLEKPGKGVTGTLNIIPPQSKLEVFQKCLPQMKTLGVIYDCCDIIPASEVGRMRGACESAGITLKEVDVKDANGIQAGTRKLLAEGIDALWVPTETFIYQNISTVTKVTHPARVPVLSSTLAGAGGEEGRKDAAILAVSIDLKELGKLAVPSVVEILTAHKYAGDIPFRTLSAYWVVVNNRAAQEIGYQIPPLLLAQANTVLKGFGGQKVVVAGTGDCQDLMRAMAGRFIDKLGEGEIVVPESVGSSGGIKALTKGDADLARIARALKKNETSQGLACRMFARTPVVFVIHQDVKGIDDITTEQLVGIYSGKLTNWRDLGAAEGKIYPVTRESGDSSLAAVSENVSGFATIQNPVAQTFYTTPQAFDAIAEHRGTIGFMPMTVAANSRLKVLKVDGVYPSPENLSNGTYKLSVPLGLAYKGEPAGLAKRFMDFAFSKEAHGIIAQYGAVPAPR
jgi:phosphate transport system substrate-binding protein